MKSGFLALRDIAGDVSFLPTEVDEERSAVAREMSNANSKSFIISNEVKNQLLGKKIDWSERISLEIKTVKETPVEAISRFYSDWYRPINQAIVVVGEINVEEVEREIKLRFSDLKNEAIPERRTYDKRDHVSLSSKNRVIMVENTPGSSSIEFQLYKIRKGEMNITHPATLKEFRMSIIDNLVNQMIRNRLKAITRDDMMVLQNLVQVIERDAIAHDSGVDAFHAQTMVKDAAEIKPVLDFTIREMKRLKEYGFSKAELDRAIREYLNSSAEKMRSESMLLNHYENGRAVPANEATLKQRLVKEIGLPEINSMLSDFLGQKDNLVVALLIPEGTRSQLPSESAMLSWIDEAWNSNVSPYVQKTIKQPVLPVVKDADKKKYNVKEIPTLNATEVVLSNGIKVVLKTLPQGEKNGVDIMLHGFRFYEQNKDVQAALPVLKHLNDFMGLGSLNYAEFSAWKESQTEMGLTLSAGPYIKGEESGIIGSSKNANAEVLLQLITAYFKTPLIDSDAFQTNLNAVKAAALRRKNRTRTLEDSIHVVMNNDPMFNRLPVENLTTLSADKVFQLYKDKFSYADGYSFVITGSFDKEAMIGLVVRYLGSLPVLNIRTSVGIKKKDSLLKANNANLNLKAVMIGDSIGNVDVRMLFKGSNVPSILDQLKLNLLREIIGQNLFVRLREKEKGVYGVSAAIQQGTSGNGFYLDIGFQTAPADVERLTDSVMDELRKLSKGELEDSTFQNAVEEVLKRIYRDMNSLYYWNTYLSEQIRRGEFSDEGLRRLELLNSITSKDVTDAIHKFFNLKAYALFEVL